MKASTATAFCIMHIIPYKQTTLGVTIWNDSCNNESFTNSNKKKLWWVYFICFRNSMCFIRIQNYKKSYPIDGVIWGDVYTLDNEKTLAEVMEIRNSSLHCFSLKVHFLYTFLLLIHCSNIRSAMMTMGN